VGVAFFCCVGIAFLALAMTSIEDSGPKEKTGILDRGAQLGLDKLPFF
jgi:hypothetical protein